MSLELLELLNYTFVQRMFLAGILASIACGIIGTYVVVKRIVFISGGIAHTTFGGIGFAYYLQYLGVLLIDPLIGALFFALSAAVILALPPIKKRIREDSTIGILWVVGMALGVLFLNLIDRSAILVQDPISILFGNVLLINSADLSLMAILCLSIIVIVALLYKDLQILTFDEEFARISGIFVDVLYLLLLVLIALTTVVLIKVVGVVLVIAMLTIPAAIANLFSKNLKKMMSLAIFTSILTTILGMIISLISNIPPGATIVLLMAAVFIASLVITFLKEKRFSKNYVNN